MFLTNFSIGYWTLHPKKVLQVLKAIHPSLKNGGEFRIANATDNKYFLLSRGLRDFINENFEYNEIRPNLLVLKKRQDRKE